MLFEMVVKILDRSKAENVDLLTAKDKLYNENPENKDILDEASAVLRSYYDEITEARREGNTDVIAKCCEKFKAKKERAKKENE